ncbi:MAG: hypothetical protein K2F87_05295 [Muribaculaceae bacterium]|nr:hypothetical protein [Muribaculaceae bacterium]
MKKQFGINSNTAGAKAAASPTDFMEDWIAFNGFRLACAIGLISVILGDSLPVLNGVLLWVDVALMAVVIVRSLLCGLGKTAVVRNTAINNLVSWWLTIPYGCFITGLLSMAKGNMSFGWMVIICGVVLMACLSIPGRKK